MGTDSTRITIAHGGFMMLGAGIQPLVYHRVCSDSEYFSSSYVVSASDFRRQMEYLVHHGYRSVRLDELLHENRSSNGTGKRVLITFDDGYRDNYTHALPVLKDLGLTAVVFLVADFTRRVNWWDTPMGVPETELLDSTHIRAMADAGVEFGSHTLFHSSLPQLPDDDLRAELRDSKAAIEAVTGMPVRAFSYPYSHVDARVKSALREAGYACGFAVNDGPLSAADDLFEIRRVNVTADAHGARFGVKLSGCEKLGLWTWWKIRRGLRGRKQYEIRRGF